MGEILHSHHLELMQSHYWKRYIVIGLLVFGLVLAVTSEGARSSTVVGYLVRIMRSL